MSSVAIIIVTYRCAEFTVACLRSLLAERAELPCLKVVVVDNASGDAPVIANTIDQEGWASWVTLIEAPRNGGFAYGNNTGFMHACQNGTPEYLHMLNPDTMIRPGAVRALADFLTQNPKVGIAGSSFLNDDGTDWPIAFRFPSLMGEIEAGLRVSIASSLLSRWSVARVMMPTPQQIDWGSGASMMVRRSLLERVGGLNEEFFLYFEETEFCWRAARAGFPMWYVPESRVVHIGGRSTKVTGRQPTKQRLPAYWFESRRRYFMATGGLLRALLIDLAAMAAYTIGSARLRLQGRGEDNVPYYVADLWRHSVFHRRNRLESKVPHLFSAMDR